MINVQWSDKTWAVVDRIEAMVPRWETVLYERMPAFFAAQAMAHIKPMMHVRPWHTGALESSLNAVVDKTANGFEIHFESLFYGMYMDTGNASGSGWVGGMMYASQFGHKAFPGTDENDGSRVFMQRIRPMGSRNPGAPTHFSEKTLDWMANSSVASDLMLSSMQQFLRGVNAV